MDFGKAFSFVFEDPDWLKKIVLAGLISLIPIVGQLYLTGYGLEVARRVIRHDPRPLPDVAFGESLGEGFKALVIGLVYSIPVYLFVLPIALVPTLAGGNGDYSGAEPLITLVSVCCSGLLILYALALSIWLPAAFGNMLARGSLGAAFRLGEVFALIKAAPGAYLLVLVGTLITGFIAPLGTIACGVGVVLTYTYGVVFMGNLYGQAYNAAIANKALM